MRTEETFTQAVKAIQESEKRIEQVVKAARMDRPRRESRLSGEQLYYITLTAIIASAITAVLLTLLLR